MYVETTEDIEVTVKPFYVPEQSDPKEPFFLFGYTVTIANRGVSKVQLLTRHWIITDGSAKVEEVRGDGVVGKQPVLEPGETFEYTSACPLRTPTGNMRGSYLMVIGERRFSARIPLFFLRHPDTFH